MEGIDTICFLSHNNIPENRRKDVTYEKIFVDYCPQKYDPYFTRLTVGGNLIKYPGEVRKIIADLTTEKLLFNSKILTPEVCLMYYEIKNIYLGKPMERYEYICLTLNII